MKIDDVEKSLAECEKMMVEISRDLCDQRKSESVPDTDANGFPPMGASFLNAVQNFENRLDALRRVMKSNEKRSQIYDEAHQLLKALSSVEHLGRNELNRALHVAARPVSTTSGTIINQSKLLAAMKQLRRIERRLSCIMLLYATPSLEIPLIEDVNEEGNFKVRKTIDVLCEAAAAVFDCSQQLLKLRVESLKQTKLGIMIIENRDFNPLNSFLDRLNEAECTLVSSETIDQREFRFTLEVCQIVTGRSSEDLTKDLRESLMGHTCIALYTFILSCATWSSLQLSAVDAYRWMKSRVYGEVYPLTLLDICKLSVAHHLFLSCP